MNKSKAKVTILYARLSKDDELQGTSNSILNQQQLLTEYAERHNLTPYIHIQEYFPLVLDYVNENFTQHGMCADIAIHTDKNNQNSHCHILLTVRPFHEDGTWGDKRRKVYILNDNGEKIYDPKKRQYKCNKIQTTDWDERHKAEEWRASWASMCNTRLEQLNHG